MSLSENTVRLLQDVTDFADKAHGSQHRKYSPERYIVHPVKVMKMCSEYTEETSVLSAALLHDVLEDTGVREHTMRSFLLELMGTAEAEKTIRIVKELTNEFTTQKYPMLNRRERKAKEHERLEKVSAEAQTIKYADIIDNCLDIVDADADFAKVFVLECHSLLKCMTRGNEELSKKAFDVIYTCLRNLE